MKPVSRGRLALALVLPCVTLIGAHALFDPLYRTNDDPAMLLLSAGSVFVDEPTPYLVFSNHAWGQLVSTLYTRLPEFPWYRVLQLLVQFAAGATLVYAALGRRLSAARLIPVACCLALFETLATARPHFTLVSAYAAIAAVILVSAGRRDEELGRIRWALFACLWIAAAATSGTKAPRSSSCSGFLRPPQGWWVRGARTGPGAPSCASGFRWESRR